MSRRGPGIFSPRSFTSPALGARRPARIFSRVDLPHPEGPTMATNSPSATSKLIRSSAQTGPRTVLYSLRRFLTSITSTDATLTPPGPVRLPSLVEAGALSFVGITFFSALECRGAPNRPQARFAPRRSGRAEPLETLDRKPGRVYPDPDFPPCTNG